MSMFSQKSFWIIFVGVAITAGIFILAMTKISIAQIDNLNTLSAFSEDSLGKEEVKNKPAPIKVKGIYLTAYSAGSPSAMERMIKLVSSTELNAMVIDIKDYSGYVLYDSQLPFVIDHKLKDVRIKNLSALIQKLHDNDIYAIARVSSFQDPLLAERQPQWALKTKSDPNRLWRDRKGLAWVDPTNPAVWSYIASIAKEAATIGFDEINFDYIRFPTDGNLANILYASSSFKKFETIGDFFKFLSQSLDDEGVYISADLFGLTTEAEGENDLRIGQRLVDAVKYFDYVCPMVYPSHYYPGYLQYENPAAHPYEVVFHSMTAGMKQVVGQRAHLRPWLQAFDMGAVYDAAKIRAQIQAADDVGTDGWILWRANNRYTNAGLLAE